LPAAHQVQMQVIDGLAAFLAAVDHYTKAFREAFLARNFTCDQHQVPEQIPFIGPGFSERTDVFAGNDKDVRGRLGADVGESVDKLVLVDASRRNVPGGDLAEEATHGVFSV